MERQEQPRDELQAQLFERAARDQVFRQELIRDPRAVIERELGIQIPPSVHIEVLEESPTRSYLILPQPPIAPGEGISDRDLEAVAGGWSGSSDCGSCVDTCGQTCGCQVSLGYSC